MNPFHRSRRISGIIPALLAALLLALTPLLGCDGDCPPDPVKHTIVITTDGTHCKLTGETGSDVTVNPGEWVVWDNQHGSDVLLNFGTARRLFGVHNAVVYPNSKLELRVRDDAAYDSPHQYTVPCAASHPGPVIVVNPPN